VFIFTDEDGSELASQLESVSVGEHAFSQMQGDLDQQRLLGDKPNGTSDSMMAEMQNKLR
jgi:hypothetical protein